jgi:hypothetical protein
MIVKEYDYEHRPSKCAHMFEPFMVFQNIFHPRL